MIDREPNVADVDPAVVEDLNLVIPTGTEDIDRQLWVGGIQCANDGSDDEAGHEADREGAGSASGTPDPPPECIGAEQQWSCLLEQLTTSRGQFGAPPVSDEQLGIELFLQRPDLTRYHGLSDMQPGGCPAEVELFGDCYEVADLAQV